MKTRINAIEYYLPEKIVSNDDLHRENPSWDMKNVESKAGVISRHIAAPEETALDLAKKACDLLVKSKDFDLNAVDGIIFCTQSSDYIMPSNAHLMHEYLNLSDNVIAFDIDLACSGFIYGSALAHSLIVAGLAKNVLLFNADTYSKYINLHDRSARVLFGDGAAVTHFTASEDDGFIDFELSSHGKEYKKFYIPAGGLRQPRCAATSKENTDRNGNVRSLENIHMDGLGVWSFINSVVPRQIAKILKRNEISLEDIDQVIFHQASKMTIDSLAKVLELDESKVFRSMETTGNLVSASIPVALKNALDNRVIKSGDRLLLSGFGVGLSYGSALLNLK